MGKRCAGCHKEIPSYPCAECGRQGMYSTEEKFTGVVIGLVMLGAVVLTLTSLDGAPTRSAPPSPASTATTSPEPTPPRVTFDLSLDCSVRSGTTWTDGSLRNTGEATVHFVQVRLTWSDAEGNVVDTNSTYAVGNEELRPGESSMYRGYTNHPEARRCQASVLSWRFP